MIFESFQDHCDWPHSRPACAQPGGVDGTPTTTTDKPKPKPPTEAVIIEEAGPVEQQKPDGQWVPDSTTSTTTKRPHVPDVTLPDTGYKVICYFTNWAIYRPGEGKYGADDIDSSLCTHIIYGFATLSHAQIMQVFDSWADTDDYGHKLYAKVTALRAKGIKVLIGLGGWNDSLGSKYSVMANNPSARAKFVQAAVEFIEKYGFDGLDLDWEYPKCWQVSFSTQFGH